MNPALVLDCSVVISWCFADEADEFAGGILDSLARRAALVPAIWPLEVANALVASERRRRLREKDSREFFSLLLTLPISVEQTPPETAWREVASLAREFSLSAYDASYLELALRHGLPLATRDERLKKAARRRGLPEAGAP